MIDHITARGGSLDFAITKTLLAERDAEWDISKNPQKYFNRVEQAIKALTRAGITSDLNKQRDMALYYLKSSREFDAAVREWENKPATNKTWTNIKTFISAEYTRENKQNKLTAKEFRANAMEEQAEATEELIVTINKNHTWQMEALIKSTTEAMKEMILILKNESKTPANSDDATKTEKQKKRDEKRKKYNKATIFKHCGKKHPSKKKDECWELEANKLSRPSTWKSTKSTWRCPGPTIEIETWQPGKVLTNKIYLNHTYLETMNYWAPLDKNNEKEQEEKEINSIKQQPATIQKPKSNKWTRRVERRRATKHLRDQQNIIIDSAATSHFMSEDLNLPKTGSS
jgi:hypothetical protein